MDGDMNDIFQKLNTILEDKDMSNNLKNIINNISSSDNSDSATDSSIAQEEKKQEDHTSNDNRSKKNSNTEKNIFQGVSEFDINTLLKIKNIMDSLNNNENDARANLLLSLKPYLADYKKDKIDQYIKFLRFTKIIEILNPMGGDKQKNE